MRLDNAGPRTWLLAAVAAWAVLTLLLAVAGMGGRVTPLPESAGLLEPLPPLPKPVDSQLGPLEQYAEIGARPLFNSDRKPKPFMLQQEEGETQETAFDYVLTSVLLTPALKMAIIQPADASESVRVKLDEAPESHPAWRLVELGERTAVFDGPEGRRTMELRVFDGQGGQAPTAIAPPSRRPVEGPILPPRTSTGRPAALTEADDGGKAEGGKPAPVAEADAAPPMTEQSQMEAIRQRIQARRAALREQAQNQQTPRPQPQPPNPPPPNPPAESR